VVQVQAQLPPFFLLETAASDMWIPYLQEQKKSYAKGNIEQGLKVGMHRISGRIIRPFLISGIRPDTRLSCRISGKAGYRISGRISGKCLADPIIYLVFLQIRQEKNCTKIKLVNVRHHALFNVCKRL
jgi:hypothetical protein